MAHFENVHAHMANYDKNISEAVPILCDLVFKTLALYSINCTYCATKYYGIELHSPSATIIYMAMTNRGTRKAAMLITDHMHSIQYFQNTNPDLR